MAITEKMGAELSDYRPSRRAQFKEECLKRGGFCPEDPVDISALPRVLPEKYFRSLEETVKLITARAIEQISAGFLPYSQKTRFLKEEVFGRFEFPDYIFGGGRFDFILSGEMREGNPPRLIELNFVNIGGPGYTSKINSALFSVYPELSRNHYYLSPLEEMGNLLADEKADSVLILTSDKNDPLSYIDRQLAERMLLKRGFYCRIVPEREFDQLKKKGGHLYFQEKKMDAIYFRFSDQTKDLQRVKEFLRVIIQSEALLYEHPLFLFGENKNLGYLSDPPLERVIAQTSLLEEKLGEARKNPEKYVLKKIDEHGGKAVYFDREIGKILKTLTREDYPEYVVQEKIHLNQGRVRTILGRKGLAYLDLSTYISFKWNTRKKEFERFKISGLLTRFSLNSYLTNMCRGGGIVPTIIQK